MNVNFMTIKFKLKLLWISMLNLFWGKQNNKEKYSLSWSKFGLLESICLPINPVPLFFWGFIGLFPFPCSWEYKHLLSVKASNSWQNGWAPGRLCNHSCHHYRAWQSSVLELRFSSLFRWCQEWRIFSSPQKTRIV